LKFTFLRAAKTLASLSNYSLARLPSLLLFVGELARVKQTARRCRRYVAMPSSSLSAATTPRPGHLLKISRALRRRQSCYRVIQWNSVFRGYRWPAFKISNGWGILAAGLVGSRGRRRSPSPRANWLFLRHFSSSDFACRCIILCRRFCRSSKSRFIS
jgi:hypothetical protein